MTIEKAIKELKKIRDNADTVLEERVVSILINNIQIYNTAEGFFEDVFERGLYSGAIREFIYQREVEAFFDKYYYDIMNLFYKMQKEEKNIEDMLPRGWEWEIKASCAWLAFEEITARIIDKLGIKI
jgi:hypothetical protein